MSFYSPTLKELGCHTNITALPHALHLRVEDYETLSVVPVLRANRIGALPELGQSFKKVPVYIAPELYGAGANYVQRYIRTWLDLYSLSLSYCYPYLVSYRAKPRAVPGLK